MSIFVEIDKVEHEIRDLEYRQKITKNGLNDLDREVLLLNIKESALSENIKNLKKPHITIVLASEYRRSRDELARAHIRLGMIKKDKENLLNALKIIEEFIEKSKTKLEDLKSKLPDNVLQFPGIKNE